MRGKHLYGEGLKVDCDSHIALLTSATTFSTAKVSSLSVLASQRRVGSDIWNQERCFPVTTHQRFKLTKMIYHYLLILWRSSWKASYSYSRSRREVTHCSRKLIQKCHNFTSVIPFTTSSCVPNLTDSRWLPICGLLSTLLSLDLL